MNRFEQLQSELPDLDIRPAAVLRDRATSFWNPAPMQGAALVRARSSAEVSALMRVCHAHGWPVVVQGGRTGCARGGEPTTDDIVLSLEAMAAIEEIDVDGRVAVVQAGAVLEQVQQAVAAHDLLLPLDLGARGTCTIGGTVATNAGGVNVLRFGMMRQRVLGLEAVTADGRVLTSMNRMLKNNAGYDLKQLFIGTEGSLGIVTRVVLKLEEALPAVTTVLAAVDDFDHLPRLLRHFERRMPGGLTAYEAMWGDYYSAVTRPAGPHDAPIRHGHPFYVLIECIDPAARQEADQDTLSTLDLSLEAAATDGLISDAVIAQSGQQARAIWAVREDFEAITQDAPCFLYDVSLPVQKMDAYVNEVRARLSAHWPDSRFYVFGHLADGNLHLFVNPRNGAAAPDDLHAQSDRLVYEPLAASGGSVSGEHGIGHEKKPWLSLSRTREEIRLMRALKQMMDPKSILNPGLVFESDAGAALD